MQVGGIERLRGYPGSLGYHEKNASDKTVGYHVVV